MIRGSVGDHRKSADDVVLNLVEAEFFHQQTFPLPLLHKRPRVAGDTNAIPLLPYPLALPVVHLALLEAERVPEHVEYGSHQGRDINSEAFDIDFGQRDDFLT